MTIQGYKADRKAMYEAVKFWKNSAVYREAGLQTEGEQLSLAPWLKDTVEESVQIVSRWSTTSDRYDGPAFDDVASEASADDVAEVLTYISQQNESELIQTVTDLLSENAGRVLYVGRSGDAEAYAIRFNEGRYMMAEMELDEALLDEGLISMTLLSQGVPDPQAPVVPGFAPIEQRLYEALHAAELIASTITESEGSGALVATIGKFCEDIAGVLVEVMTDQGSLSDKEIKLVIETFLGAYAGIVEEAKQFA